MKIKIRLRRSRKLAGGLGLLLALALMMLLAVPALAIQQQPHQFYGSVTVCGTPVDEEGTVVSALIDGIEYPNSTTTVDGDGNYGYDPVFKLPADDTDPGKTGGVNGDPVEFYVHLNGVPRLAGTSVFQIDGGTELPLNVTEVDLTVASTVGGTVTDPGEDTFTYNCSQVVDLLADPDTCYEFVEWTGDVATVDNPDAADTFITMNGFYEITANFALLEYTITPTAGDNGSISPLGEVTVNCGDNQAFTITPDACYEIADVLVDGTSALADVTIVEGVGTYTFENVVADHTIHATFALQTFTISATAGDNGSISPSGDVVVDCGGSQAFTITADPGYGIDDVLVDDESVGAVGSYLFENVTANHTIHATFAIECLVTYDLTVNSSTGGSVTDPGEDTFTYCEDEVVDLVAEPDTCYEFVNWTGDVADPNLAETTVTMDGNKTVTANFALIEYELTVNADPTEGGEVTGGGIYDCCTDQPITATPADTWYFVNWTGEGIAEPNSAETTVHIDGDKTVTAHFALVAPQTLTVNGTAGGEVTAPGEDTFTYPGGTVVPLVAEPDQCASFVNWTGDDVSTVADVNAATTTITMNDDYTITANFESPEVLTTIPLTTGWNTFSTPIYLDPCCDTWEDLFALSGIEDEDVGAIYCYNGSTGQWDEITGGAVQPLEGYYLKLMNLEDELSISIVPYWDNPEPDILPRKLLATGLNFIGTPSLVDRDVVTALGDIYLVPGVGYSRVINPEENPNDWADTEYLRGTTPVPTMMAFKAYWVIMGISEEPLYLYGSLPPTP